MLSIFDWVITSFGLALIITQSKIFKSFRERIRLSSTFLGDLVRCIMCTGFWIGIALSLLFDLGPNIHLIRIKPIRIFADGFATSGIVWIIYVVLYRYFQDPAPEEKD